MSGGVFWNVHALPYCEMRRPKVCLAQCQQLSAAAGCTEPHMEPSLVRCWTRGLSPCLSVGVASRGWAPGLSYPTLSAQGSSPVCQLGPTRPLPVGRLSLSVSGHPVFPPIFGVACYLRAKPGVCCSLSVGARCSVSVVPYLLLPTLLILPGVLSLSFPLPPSTSPSWAIPLGLFAPFLSPRPPHCPSQDPGDQRAISLAGKQMCAIY